MKRPTHHGLVSATPNRMSQEGARTPLQFLAERNNNRELLESRARFLALLNKRRG